MTLRDLVVISMGNLRRLKLRTFLTASGVLIAIAAFVAMISFGAGNQKYIEEEFNKLGLFSTMTVSMPKNRSDTSSVRLDLAALDRLAAIPGVNLVYPYDAFALTVHLGDSTVETKAQALPSTAMRLKLFSGLLAGSAFEGDSSHSVIISEALMRQLGITSPDSAIGMRLAVSVRVSTIDSALIHVLVDKNGTIIDRLKRIRPDSLRRAEYRNRVIRTEANEAVKRFVGGFMNARREVSDTLTISGVRSLIRAGRLRLEPVFLPIATAARFSSAGFGGSPVEMFTLMSSGNFFGSDDGGQGKTFTQVTIDFDPKVLYSSIRDSVKAMGFETFSFAEQFEEIQKVFLYFDLALGVVGLIALVTASLGIVNTMVMSVTERKREIGVLKSLGADESDIRRLFLAESAVIGALGTAGGILFGWGMTRIVSAVAKSYMRREGVPEMELFALPPWLILTALAVGIGVSIAAGLYPAARAARVDPVEALRNE